MKRLIVILSALLLLACNDKSGIKAPPAPPPPPAGTAAELTTGTETKTRVWSPNILATQFGGAAAEVVDEALTEANMNDDTSHAPSQEALYEWAVGIDADLSGTIELDELPASAFAQTFLDDDNATEALTTLGAQAADATLTDIADGTIAENLVNTANPWADNEVANDLTIADGTIGTSTINLLSSDASPSTTAGQIRHDSTVTGLLTGALAWYDGDEVRYLVDLDVLPSDDTYVVAYSATDDKFYMKADATGEGGSFSITDITGQTDDTTPASTATVVLAQGGSLIESTVAQIVAAGGGGDVTAVGDCASGDCTMDAALDSVDISPTSGTWDISNLTSLVLPIFKNGTTSAGEAKFAEDGDEAGGNYMTLRGAAALADDTVVVTLPGVTGTLLTSGEINTAAELETVASLGAFASDLLGYTNAAAVRTGIGIDTAANLETNLSLGAYFSDIAAATSEANFKGIVNLEANTDFVAPTGTANIQTTGTIKGLQAWGANVTASTNHDTDELFGVMYDVTGTATVTLDAAADVGYGGCARYEAFGAYVITLDPQAGEKMRIDGVALAAGVAVESSGVTGDNAWICTSTDTDGSGTDGYIVTSHKNFATQ